MEIESLLKKIIQFGKDEGYFQETILADLHKSCCKESPTMVIDFDKAKDKITAAQGTVQSPKSCDALKILPGTKRLDFIELKSIKKYIQHQLRSNGPSDRQNRSKIQDFDLIGKIKDSIYVMQTLLFLRKLQLSQSQRSLFNRVPKNFIVVVDIETDQHPLEHIALSLSFLSRASTPIEKQIASILKEEVAKIPASPFDNIHQPVLMNCKSVDAYYAQIDDSLHHA